MVAMSQIYHTCLWVFLYTLLGRDHPSDKGMDSVVLALIDRDTDLEDYSPCNPNLKPKLPYLRTQWIHICLSD